MEAIKRYAGTFGSQVTLELAGCPEDGGKWALMCEHLVEGEWVNAGIIQDTNKRNLATWVHAKRGAGYTDWCPECQEANGDLVRW